MKISLVPMTEKGFKDYLKISIPEYAREKSKAEGWSSSEAKKIAEDSFVKLLPQGVGTPDHYLYVLQTEDKEEVGYLWFGKKSDQKKKLYLYDIKIHENAQGHGYGEAAMLALEKKAKELGYKFIALHVFGHNQRAQNLYQKLGYQITNLNMVKKI